MWHTHTDRERERERKTISDQSRTYWYSSACIALPTHRPIEAISTAAAVKIVSTVAQSSFELINCCLLIYLFYVILVLGER